MRRIAGVVRGLPISTILLIASVLLNAALARRVTSLRAGVAALKAEGSLPAGQIVPPLTVSDLAGRNVAIAYNDVSTPTLLYVFTPQCSWCYRNLANLTTLADQAKGRYRLLGLSLTTTDLAPYVAEHKLSFPVYVAGPEAARAYKLGGTPQTLLVGSDGKLIKNWKGAYQDDLKTAIEKEMGIQLPGLIAGPPKRVGA